MKNFLVVFVSTLAVIFDSVMADMIYPQVSVIDYSVAGWLSLFQSFSFWLALSIVILFVIVIFLRKNLQLGVGLSIRVILMLGYIYIHADVIVTPFIEKTHALTVEIPNNSRRPKPNSKFIKVPLQNYLKEPQVVRFFFVLHFFTFFALLHGAGKKNKVTADNTSL